MAKIYSFQEYKNKKAEMQMLTDPDFVAWLDEIQRRWELEQQNKEQGDA